ncbi:M16 family metallopeptidase [Sphingomonas morindae]|uniref:Insulinase family protein n=1 Tax=Sphingomonas morindae TaxID=1541170 RepID=A0ABY4X8X9_9SPHN|nr:pitrilysin family protein [Sphingomonas morindae]USI73392.1 insulinase family protein [Sphingomonas morindae]
MSARLHRLANGLTVAVEPMAGVETLAVGLYADVGSRSEPDGLTGLAHMVEHMVFKGAGGRDARQIAEAAEDVGGQLNAWTSRDTTTFHARLLPGDLALGIDLIADLVRAPLFDGEELEREKQVVLAELGEARDTPDDIVFDHLAAAAYPGQVYGRPVLGEEETIAAIQRDHLAAWLADQYRPAGLTLAAAGKVDEDVLLRLAEARFGDLAAGAPPAFAPARFAGGTVTDQRRFDQVHVAFAYPGVDQRDGALHALNLFAGAAGGGMSSRLFQEVREARGLAYSIYAWAQTAADTGQLGVYLAAARAEAPRAFALARDVLARTAETLDQAELDRAKAQAKAGLLMGLESVQARCDHLARQIQVHGRAVPVGESVAAIDAVDLAAARAAGAAALDGALATASVGGKLARVA